MKPKVMYQIGRSLLFALTAMIFLAAPLQGRAISSELLSAKNELRTKNELLTKKDSLKRTPLHHAVVDNDVDSLKALIESGVNLDKKDKHGNTALNLAALFHYWELTEVLLEAGADPNTKNKSGNTPLISILLDDYYDIEIIRPFLIYGADVDVTDKFRNTPLHMAARADFPDIVILLVDHGADINAKNKEKMSVLEVAMENTLHSLTVFELIKKGADADVEYDDTPLITAMIGWEIPSDVIKAAIANGASIEARDLENITPLTAALMSGNKEIVSELIVNGADVNARIGFEEWPLLSACIESYVDKELIILLMDAGADLDADDGMEGFVTRPIYQASMYDTELFIELVKRGAKLVDYENMEWYDYEDLYDYTDLNAGLVDLLLQGGQEEYSNIKEYPLVENSIFMGVEDETILQLISKGCCIVCGMDGWFNAIAVAIINDKSEILKAIIDSGVEMDEEYEYEGEILRPLEFAVMYERRDMVDILLDNGADPNFSSNWGYDTFFEMVLYETFEVDLVIRLLDAGAELGRDDVEYLDSSDEMLEAIYEWFNTNE